LELEDCKVFNQRHRSNQQHESHKYGVALSLKKTVHKKSQHVSRKQPTQSGPLHTTLKRLSSAKAATQAILLASLLLVASAVFLSQTDKIFAKAANSNIRGSMVLADRGSFSQAQSSPHMTSAVLAPVALPGTSCSVIVTGCMFTFDRQYWMPDLLFDDSSKASGMYTFVSTPTSVINAQNICTKTGIFTAPGGLHTVKIQTPTAFTGASGAGISGITHAAIAYDCTP